VYIGARSQEKAEEAIKGLKEITGKEASFLKLDLADLKAVKAAAEEFLRYGAVSYSLSTRSYSFDAAKKASCISCTIMGMSRLSEFNRYSDYGAEV
jgi:NAD(P)-dependent dehydrogenase (short-subunit alcohol dehydrogenase family)